MTASIIKTWLFFETGRGQTITVDRCVGGPSGGGATLTNQG